MAPPEVVEIARLAKTVERYYGFPQDIEWAIDRHRHASAGATAVLLQTRPETVWSSRLRTPAPTSQGAGVSSIIGTMLGPGRLPE
jgi:pyruvate,water dikinase